MVLTPKMLWKPLNFAVFLEKVCLRLNEYGHKNIKKRLLLRCIHHFKADLINNMDHMRISGTEPSSVILSQKRVVSKVGK